MVMALREVLVQLDDDLVGRLDQITKNLGVSRAELIRRGVRAVVEADSLRVADDELVAAYRRLPLDPELVLSAARLAALTFPE